MIPRLLLQTMTAIVSFACLTGAGPVDIRGNVTDSANGPALDHSRHGQLGSSP